MPEDNHFNSSNTIRLRCGETPSSTVDMTSLLPPLAHSPSQHIPYWNTGEHKIRLAHPLLATCALRPCRRFITSRIPSPLDYYESVTFLRYCLPEPLS